MWISGGIMQHFAIFCLLYSVSYCSDSTEENSSGAQNEVPKTDPVEGEELVNEMITSGNQMKKTVEGVEQIADMNVTREDSEEECEKKWFEKMNGSLNHLMELMTDSNNVFKFIEAKGIERVIYPNLQHEEVRDQLLTLTQLLFDVAPNITSLIIPTGIMDKLLDIFEKDDNIAFKSKTLYILSVWLPDNPKMQARVMKKMGLEPFYHQMPKLDANAVNEMMRLLSKIIKEHIRVRITDLQQSKKDPLKMSIYKRIGMIEMLQTGKVCHGLFQVFNNIWEKAGDNHGFLYPVFEIISDVQPYCTDKLRGRTDSVNMLQAMHKHIDDVSPSAKDLYESLGLNTTQFKLVLEKYLQILSPNYKDEL